MLSLLQTSFGRIMVIGMAWSCMASLNVIAAVEQVALKADGQIFTSVGRKGCNGTGNVEVQLTNQLKNRNEFQVFFKEVKKETDVSKVKGESLCDQRLSMGRSSVSFTKSSPTIPLQKFLTSSACQSNGVSEARVVCFYEGVGANDELVAYALYRIETAVANIDSIGERTAVNGEVSFEVKIKGNMGNNTKIETCFGKSSAGNIDTNDQCDAPFKIFYTTSTQVTISDLEPVEWSFKVRLNDPKDLPTPWQPSFKETPIHVAFPFSTYNGKGGDFQWSCTQSNGNGTSILFLVALLSLLSLRVRKRTVHICLTSVMGFIITFTVIVPKSSHAEFGAVNVGILGSMYRPDLDSEKRADGEKIFPFYKCFFRKKTAEKNGPINPLMGGEVDVHLFDGFGSLQLGFGLGYTFVNGRALNYDSEGNPDCDSPVTSAKSTLHLYQVRPQLTYAFDLFAETVPLVPYIRGALIGHGYIFRHAGSKPKNTSVDGYILKPNGLRFGYQAAVGLMLMLDFLEPSALKTSRGQGYLDHVYLKGELSYTKIDTFGRRGYQFSAKDVMGTSLPLLWTFGLVFEIP